MGVFYLQGFGGLVQNEQQVRLEIWLSSLLVRVVTAIEVVKHRQISREGELNLPFVGDYWGMKDVEVVPLFLRLYLAGMC